MRALAVKGVGRRRWSAGRMAEAGVGATPWSMTAKEQLLERVTKLSEAEANETLRLLDMRGDPVVVAFCDAPEDDEPWTDEDEAAAAEGRADIEAGRTVSHEEIKREFGIE